MSVAPIMVCLEYSDLSTLCGAGSTCASVTVQGSLARCVRVCAVEQELELGV